jgi:hypothetical protein
MRNATNGGFGRTNDGSADERPEDPIVCGDEHRDDV